MQVNATTGGVLRAMMQAVRNADARVDAKAMLMQSAILVLTAEC
jgi:hypothetical protein